MTAPEQTPDPQPDSPEPSLPEAPEPLRAGSYEMTGGGIFLVREIRDRAGNVTRTERVPLMSRQRMNVHFKRVCQAAGIGRDWQPRETRHTFVSIASSNGVSIEDIADAAGHVNSNVTRAVYRHQIADTVTKAPAAMDRALAGGKTA